MKLKIIIEGPKGSGKTLAALFIQGIMQPLVKLYDINNKVEICDGKPITKEIAENNHMVIITREMQPGEGVSKA